MTDNPYYSAEVHGEFELFTLPELVTESGRTLNNVQLAYTTCGNLAPAKDNVVLVTTWFSGNHSIMKQLFVGEGARSTPPSTSS